jgi:Carbohydrate-binding module 48 (Isoamylase N-terminal domain)
MAERDDHLERAIAQLREPVRLDADLDRRIAARIATLPPPKRAGALRVAAAWLVERQLRVRPVWALAAAALLVVATWGVHGLLTAPPAAATAASGPAAQTVRFVVLAPGAAHVSVVGDFNDWTEDATPMQRIATSNLWAASVSMKPGRYRYAFVADGTTWLVDPDAPRALDDDFGRPNSVVTIGGS